MSEPLLNVMKVMLLAGLYLFFVRVLWSVFSELRDPRTVARKRAKAAGAGADPVRSTTRQPVPAAADNYSSRSPAQAAKPAMQPAGAAATTFAPAQGQLVIGDPRSLAGTKYSLGTGVTLGRAATNGIVLDDTYVSTVHARIFLINGTYFIEDLASRNGSTLNGEVIVATTALVPGDQLQLGAITMEFT